jgi:hypothetical protein
MCDYWRKVFTKLQKHKAVGENWLAIHLYYVIRRTITFSGSYQFVKTPKNKYGRRWWWRIANFNFCYVLIASIFSISCFRELFVWSVVDKHVLIFVKAQLWSFARSAQTTGSQTEKLVEGGIKDDFKLSQQETNLGDLAKLGDPSIKLC